MPMPDAASDPPPPQKKKKAAADRCGPVGGPPTTGSAAPATAPGLPRSLSLIRRAAALFDRVVARFFLPRRARAGIGEAAARASAAAYVLGGGSPACRSPSSRQGKARQGREGEGGGTGAFAAQRRARVGICRHAGGPCNFALSTRRRFQPTASPGSRADRRSRAKHRAHLHVLCRSCLPKVLNYS